MKARDAAIRIAVAEWVPDSQVEHIEPLGGGMSAEMFALHLDSEPRTIIARFPGEFVRTLFDDPAAHEFKVLEAIRSRGIPCPQPLALGTSDEGNFLLMSYIEGKATAATANVSATIEATAGMLSRIHAAPVGEDLEFLPKTKEHFQPRDSLNEDLREHEIVRTLQLAGPRTFDRLVLRHGDFWPGNLIWHEGSLVGVIDWENALIGPAIADLSISRLDIAWCFGFEAMEEFTTQYVSRNPIDLADLAYWDLRISLRSMSNLEDWVAPYASLDRPDITHAHLRRVLLEFVEDALKRA